MGKEIEKRFFKFNEKKLKDVLLNELNAKYKGTYIFKVWKMKVPSNMDQSIHTLRVRDEGRKRTFTIKKRGGKEKFDTEFEVKIEDPEEMLHMLKLMDFDLDHYYEKVRSIYNVGTSEVIIDYYPGMPDSAEVESKNVGLLKKLMKKLELNDNEEDQNENKKFYEYYGIKGGFDERIGKMRDGYTFQNVLKNYKQYATKNQNEFKKYMEKQNKFYNQVKKENNKNK
jgi:adenylate cyclase class IV